MDDASRMGLDKRFCGLYGDVERFQLLERRSLDHFGKRRTLDVLHHYEALVTFLPDFINGADVRMVQFGR
jgi:hypothetical protein